MEGNNKNLVEYQTFLTSLEQKLTNKGFEIKRDIQISPFKVDWMALKASFEVSKFGKMTRTITVTSIENVDVETIQNFSILSTIYALDNHSSLLRRVVVGGRLLSIPVIVSDDFDMRTKQWMELTVAKKHYAAFEFPVLISLKDTKIYYCKKTPIWGSAYYRGFRKFVEETLGF